MPRLATGKLPPALLRELLEGLREVDEHGRMRPLRRFARDELARLF